MDLQTSKDPPTHYGIHITSLLAANGIFPKINHILGQRESLNKHTKIEIAPSRLYAENGIHLDINSNSNYRKLPSSRRLNRTPLNHS